MDKKIAFVRAKNLPVSKKHSAAISLAIKGKTAKESISKLESVIEKKSAIKFKGEIPHRKGMMSGRYPVKASKVFIKLIRGLVANALVKGIDVENAVIYSNVDDAGKQLRPGRKRRRFKRCHITLKLEEKEIEEKPKKK